jgi:hypothetical protein
MLRVGGQRSVRNTSSGRRGGARTIFCERESPAPLAVARFLSTMVPDTTLEKILAKSVYPFSQTAEVFTNEDRLRPQLDTLKLCYSPHFFEPRAPRCG